MEPSDADIVGASAARPELFETIFRRHHRRIWAYLARNGGPDRADEIAGDVFVSAFAQRARYDPTRGTVVAWLYGIATNLNRSRFRQAARATKALARVAGQRAVQDGPATSAVDDVVAALDHESELGRVQAALAALPERDRELITLIAWERLSYAEVASVLDLEIGTVRSRLSRVRRRLRELAGLDGQSTVTDRKLEKEGR